MKELLHENEYMTSWVEDGIIWAVYKPTVREITLEITRQVVQDRISASKGITRPLFIDMGKVVDVDQASREYFSEGDGAKYLSAAAILVKSEINKFLANIYIRFNKPKIPTKFFTKRDEAIRWVSQFKYLN